MHAGLFWCFHNPSNSDIDHKIFIVRMLAYGRAASYMNAGDSRFIVSPEALHNVFYVFCFCFCFFVVVAFKRCDMTSQKTKQNKK